jgi:ketosteroid isomerase-like protein
LSALYTSADEAEEAFYEAIARGDLETLMGIWSEDEDIVCIHPTGQRLSGAAAIRESWQTILANNPRFSVRIKQRVRWSSVLLCVHSVIETLQLGDEPTPHGPMLSTNVFQRGVHGWRLLSRHTSAASMEDPSGLTEDSDHCQRTLH